MKLSQLKFVLMSALVAIALSPGPGLAKGKVTGKAYLNASAPKRCNFKDKQDTQPGCTHEACNTAVKNAIAQVQRAQPDDECKSFAMSRGCEYWNCD